MDLVVALVRLLLVRVMCIVLLVALGACASKADPEGDEQLVDGAVSQQMGLNPADPWEGYNRSVFAFNDWVDRNVLVPVAKGYRAIAPEPVRTGVGNFFSNLGEPVSVVNNLLQGDLDGAITSVMRFTTNTVFGLFGILDIATEVGMREDDEDLGQTLGAWGVEQGNYLVLPFFGPSTTRDIFSYADRLYYDSSWPAENREQYYAAFALNIINLRAGLLDLEDQIFGDRYTFIRDAYLQRREFLVNDGEVVEDEFGEDEFFDEEDFDNLDDEF